MERPWMDTAEGQLVAPGHAAGDVLRAYEWRMLDRSPGRLVIDAELPDALKNPQGQLFGGFTPTYVDFVSIFTLHTLDPESDPTSPKTWVTTLNMRIDYFEPIVGPTFSVEGEVVNQRGLNALVSTKFWQGDGDSRVMAAHALTTLRQVPGIEAPSPGATPS